MNSDRTQLLCRDGFLKMDLSMAKRWEHTSELQAGLQKIKPVLVDPPKYTPPKYTPKCIPGLPGDFKVGDKVSIQVNGPQQFDDSEPLKKGDVGIVRGPAKGEKNKVEVEFN